MPRLSDAELDTLKNTIDLLRLVEAQGYSLKKQGKDFVMQCPFHEEKTPSLLISPHKNVFHCFGCNAKGTVIDWVMKTQGVSFKHAVEILRSDPSLAANPSSRKKIPKRASAKKLDSLFDRSLKDQQLLNQVTDYYHQTLKQTPEALAYLDKRGLNHPELIDTFKLGYSNRTLSYRLLSRDSQAGKQQRKQLIDIGLLRTSGHEHFNGCITIPIIDEQHNIKQLYGRRIREDVKKDASKHLYLPGPQQGIFNYDALRLEEVILCESLIDALTFWVNGFRNVTTSYGVNGFTNELLNAFKNNNVQSVLIAYDRDEAGNTAADKLAKQLNKDNIDAYRVLLPKGMDINEYALQVKPAQKSLSLAIRKAQWLVSGKPKTNITSDTTKTHTELDDAIETLEEVATALETKPTELPAPEQASPVPPAPASDIQADVDQHEIRFTFSNRYYRIRGFNKNLSYDQLKINLLVQCNESIYSDIFDLYSAKHRLSFIKQASLELGIDIEHLKKDIGQLLLKLEALQDESIRKNQETTDKQPVELSEAEHKAALSLLKDKHLLKKILSDFATCGIIGEETNKLVGYLACVSRKLDKPLAVIIQSSSAAGKSSLMDAILNLMPEEERIQYSAMTGQSLFYMGETDLKHKILAISEEEGAENASYALKLLQSEGEITIASTGKDESTGNLVTKEYKVEGPVMLFLTTTAIDIDEELMNRCLVLTVNESREHTQAIHQQQRFDETLDGLLASEQKNELIKLHRNAQRLLKPLKVVNPYAEQLTFLNDKTRTRRDHKKYLMLIRSIALLHQYQRDIKHITHQGKQVDYIEVTLNDIETANQLAHDVLGRTLDELPPQTRELLKRIHHFVENECEINRMDQQEVRFTRKDLRDYTGWGNTQLKLHLTRLVEMEYLMIHSNGHKQRYRYELLYNGDINNPTPHMIGLIDTDTLKTHYDSNRSGQKALRSGCGRPAVGVQSGGGRSTKNSKKTNDDKHLPLLPVKNAKNALLNGKNKTAAP